jgi:hypothetical protein
MAPAYCCGPLASRNFRSSVDAGGAMHAVRPLAVAFHGKLAARVHARVSSRDVT